MILSTDHSERTDSVVHYSRQEERGVIKITEINKMADGMTYYELLGVDRNASEKEVV